MNRKIRVAFVGGGGAKTFFGPVHRRSIQALDDFEIVAGTLHQDPEVARTEGQRWGLQHIFTDYREMMKVGRRDGLFDYVVVVTPNKWHFDPAMAALEEGIPVMCEKPLTKTLEEARRLYATAKKHKVPFGVNYTYGGHWSMKLARAFVTSGVLGPVRRTVASYLQGWQRVNLKIQQEHRQDPDQSGDWNCNGDINSHNHFATRYVTGLEVNAVCCVPRIHVKERVLDDDVDCIVELSNGGGGLSFASQIACGHLNDHRLGVYCERGSVRWMQERAQELNVVVGDGPELILKRGGDLGLDLLFGSARIRVFCGPENMTKLEAQVGAIARFIHLPGGHHEEFFEAVGNNHYEFGQCVCAWQKAGKNEVPTDFDFPTILDGLRGMEFLDTCKVNRDGREKFTPVSFHS